MKLKDSHNHEFYLKREGLEIFDPIFNRRRFIGSAGAYIITAKAAQKLLSLAFPIRLPADYLLGLLSYHGLQTYACYPHSKLVCNGTLGSTIDSGNSIRPRHKFE